MGDQAYVVPDDRRYTANHIWLKKDGDVYTAGITDYAQSQLGQIVFVDMPKPEDEFSANAKMGTIESVKTVSELMMPVQGEIRLSNMELGDNPGLVNNDCYGKGWITKIIPSDKESVNKLMDADAYRDFIK